MQQYLNALIADVNNLPSTTQFELNKLPSWQTIPDNLTKVVGKAFRDEVRGPLGKIVTHIGFTNDRHDFYEKN